MNAMAKHEHTLGSWKDNIEEQTIVGTIDKKCHTVVVIGQTGDKIGEQTSFVGRIEPNGAFPCVEQAIIVTCVVDASSVERTIERAAWIGVERP